MNTNGNLSSRKTEFHPSAARVEMFSSGMGNLHPQDQDSNHSSLGQPEGQQEKRVRPLEQALTLEVARLTRQLDALKLQIDEREQQFSKLDRDFEKFCRTNTIPWDIPEPILRAPLDRKTKALRTLKTTLRNWRSSYGNYSSTTALIACLVMPGVVTWYSLTLLGPKSSVVQLAPNAKEIIYQPVLSQVDSKVTAQVTYPKLIQSPTTSPAQSTTATPGTTAMPTQNASVIPSVGTVGKIAPASLVLPPNTQRPVKTVQPKLSAREYEQAVYYALIDRNLAEFNTALERAYQIDPSFHNLKDLRRTYISLKQSGASEAQMLYTLQSKVIHRYQKWLSPEQLQRLQNQV